MFEQIKQDFDLDLHEEHLWFFLYTQEPDEIDYDQDLSYEDNGVF